MNLQTEAIDKFVEEKSKVRHRQEARIVLGMYGLAIQGASFSKDEIAAAYEVWNDSALTS